MLDASLLGRPFDEKKKKKRVKMLKQQLLNLARQKETNTHAHTPSRSLCVCKCVYVPCRHLLIAALHSYVLVWRAEPAMLRDEVLHNIWVAQRGDIAQFVVQTSGHLA